MNADELGAVQTRLDASLPYDPEASTITVVVGLSVREVLEAFGADPDEPPISCPGGPMRGQNTLCEIGGGGTQVALHNGWAYDVSRRVWIELPTIPDRGYGFMSAASVWAGDRLLLFANAAVGPVDDEDHDTRVVRVHDGWAWQPPRT